MSVEHAAQLQAGSKRRPRKTASSTNRTISLRLAERPVRDRVQRLVDLAAAVLRDAETLARDKVFTERSARLRSLDATGGIDFYEEVKEFESGLIKIALEQTGGNQAKAAELLRLKPTTLNSKIKLYKIECRQ